MQDGTGAIIIKGKSLKTESPCPGLSFFSIDIDIDIDIDIGVGQTAERPSRGAARRSNSVVVAFEGATPSALCRRLRQRS